MTDSSPYQPDYITLYDFTKENVQLLAQMPYEQALHTKIEAAKALLAELYKPHFTERDTPRISRVYKAIRFNTMLLKELT